MQVNAAMESVEPIISKIREMEPALRQQGAQTLFVFGLAAHGNSRPGSDVDVLVGAEDLPLPQLAAITELLGEGLDLSVHVTTPRALDAATRSTIEARATRIF